MTTMTMEKSTKSQKDSKRLSTVLELLGLSPYKMAKILGYKSPASIYNVVNEEGNATLSIDMANKIVSEFPQVNYLYLTKAKGEPILTQESEIDAQRKLFDNKKPAAVASGRENYVPERNSSDFSSYQIEQLVRNSFELNILVRELIKENKELREVIENKI